MTISNLADFFFITAGNVRVSAAGAAVAQTQRGDSVAKKLCASCGKPTSFLTEILVSADRDEFTHQGACYEKYLEEERPRLLAQAREQAVSAATASLDSKAVEDYIKKSVGISRDALNIRAAIGLIVFGWLMYMNYADLGRKRLGWAFLIAMGFVIAIGRLVEPIVGILGLVIYVAAWVHTNAILTEKQRIAREQYFKEKNTDNT